MWENLRAQGAQQQHGDGPWLQGLVAMCGRDVPGKGDSVETLLCEDVW